MNSFKDLDILGEDIRPSLRKLKLRCLWLLRQTIGNLWRFLKALLAHRFQKLVSDYASCLQQVKCAKGCSTKYRRRDRAKIF